MDTSAGDVKYIVHSDSGIDVNSDTKTDFLEIDAPSDTEDEEFANDIWSDTVTDALTDTFKESEFEINTTENNVNSGYEIDTKENVMWFSSENVFPERHDYFINELDNNINIQSPGFDDLETDVQSQAGVDDLETDVQSQTGVDDLETDVQSQTGFDDLETDVQSQTGVDDLETDVQSQTGVDDLETDVQSQTVVVHLETDVQSQTGVDDLETDVQAQTGVDDLATDVQSQTGVDDLETDVQAQTGVDDLETDVQAQTGVDDLETDVQSQTGVDDLETDGQAQTGVDDLATDVYSQIGVDDLETDVQSQIGVDDLETDVQAQTGVDDLETDVQSKNGINVQTAYVQSYTYTNVMADNQTDEWEKESNINEFADLLGPVMTFDLVGPVGEQLLCPKCLSVSSTGEIVVTDTESCFVIIYSSTGEYLSHFSTIPKRVFYILLDIAQYRPQDVAWLSSKRVVYTKPAGCQVVISDWKGKSTVTIEGRPLYEPYGVSVDKSDNIYVTDRRKGRILCYNSNGKLIKSLGVFGSREVLKYPHYIQVTNTENICVNELCDNKIRVRVYSKSGTSSCVVANADDQELGSLAVDSDGFVIQVASDGLVVCPPPTGHNKMTTDLLVSSTLTSDLMGITLTDTGQLVCIDRKNKQVNIFVWKNHKDKLTPFRRY